MKTNVFLLISATLSFLSCNSPSSVEEPASSTTPSSMEEHTSSSIVLSSEASISSVSTSSDDSQHSSSSEEVEPLSSLNNLSSIENSSSSILENSPPEILDLQINGAAQQGEFLLASYTFFDNENDEEGTSLFQWFRNGEEITNEQSSGYTIQAEDIGTDLSVQVTPISTDGQSGTGVLSPVLHILDPDSEFTDSRDDKVYRFVNIGTQRWMAENLNYERLGSYCYDNDETNCELYGRLYTWESAMNGADSSSSEPSGVRGACPSGWHLPSRSEWGTLLQYIYDDIGETFRQVAPYLKADYGWSNSGGNNRYGFSAVGGGYRDPLNNHFFELRNQGTWWASSMDFYGTPHSYMMEHDISDFLPRTTNSELAISVRCVEN